MSASDDRSADTPRERRGLLGLLRRLFGGGRPAVPPAAPATASDQPAGSGAPGETAAASETAHDPRWQRPAEVATPEEPPARPAAWEGPLPRGEAGAAESAQPVSADPWENPAESAAEAAVAAEPPVVDTAPPPVTPVPEPPSAADEEGTLPEATTDQPQAVEVPADTPAPTQAGAVAESAGDAVETPGGASSDAVAVTNGVDATLQVPEAIAASGEQVEQATVAAEQAAPESAADAGANADAATSETVAQPEQVERPEQEPAARAPEAAAIETPAEYESAAVAEAAAAAPVAESEQPLAAAAKPLSSPLDRARAALEEARRQMPGLMADAAPAVEATSQPPADAAGRAYAAEWPGLLEGLRQAREGLAGEINVLRGVVNDLRREVGRLSDVVTGMQRADGTPQQQAGLQQTLPRLQAMLDQLRAVSGSMEGHVQQPLMSASGAPLTPPVRVQVPRPNGMPPTLPEIVWSTPVPHEHVYVPQPEAAAQPTPPAPAPQPAPAHAHGPAMLLVIAPVEGLAKLSALERRLAASSAVQRLDLGGYRRGEASFRLVLAAGASIHDVVRVAPEPGATVADVRLEGNLARVQLSPREAAQPASSPS